MFKNDLTFWLIGFAVVAVSLVAMRLLIRCAGAYWQPARLLKLHRDEVGSVQSLSFVLTLPLFIMIIMGIVQASQIMIAKVVLEYSAIASARSASVWIPAHLADFQSESRNRVGTLVPGETTDLGRYYELAGDETPKIFRIRMAAVQACLPIAPSRATGYGIGPPGGEAYDSLVKAYGALVPDEPNSEAIARRIRNKLAYSLANTRIAIKIFHPNADPPLQQIYENIDQYDRTYVIGMIPGDPPIPVYHPDYVVDAASYQDNEVGWQDVIMVTVHHDLALLPGPGRLLSRMVNYADGRPDRISEKIQQQSGVYTWPLVATASASNEGQTSILRYEHRYTGQPF